MWQQHHGSLPMALHTTWCVVERSTTHHVVCRKASVFLTCDMTEMRRRTASVGKRHGGAGGHHRKVSGIGGVSRRKCQMCVRVSGQVSGLRT